MLDETGWKVCFSPLEGSGKNSSDPWPMFEGPFSEFSGRNWILCGHLVSYQRESFPKSLAISPWCHLLNCGWLQEKKKADLGRFCNWASLTINSFMNLRILSSKPYLYQTQNWMWFLVHIESQIGEGELWRGIQVMFTSDSFNGWYNSFSKE